MTTKPSTNFYSWFYEGTQDGKFYVKCGCELQFWHRTVIFHQCPNISICPCKFNSQQTKTLTSQPSKQPLPFPQMWCYTLFLSLLQHQKHMRSLTMTERIHFYHSWNRRASNRMNKFTVVTHTRSLSVTDAWSTFPSIKDSSCTRFPDPAELTFQFASTGIRVFFSWKCTACASLFRQKSDIVRMNRYMVSALFRVEWKILGVRISNLMGSSSDATANDPSGYSIFQFNWTTYFPCMRRYMFFLCGDMTKLTIFHCPSAWLGRNSTMMWWKGWSFLCSILIFK